jgi:hypothetical protein
MKLWLDDERPAPGPEWTVATTSGAAILAVMAAIRKFEVFEACSLDHDLADKQTGMDFVDWLAKTRTWPLMKPTVHSANFWGAKNMKALIDRAGPYVDGRRTSESKSRLVHPNTRLGTHPDCPDPACCSCACPGCMTDWKATGKPLQQDCGVHGRS